LPGFGGFPGLLGVGHASIVVPVRGPC
jgi:hypothetical protein